MLQHRLQRRLVEPGQGLGGRGGGADGQTDLPFSLHPAVAGVPPGVVPLGKVDAVTRGVVRAPPVYHRPWTSQSHPAIPRSSRTKIFAYLDIFKNQISTGRGGADWTDSFLTAELSSLGLLLSKMGRGKV